MAKSKLILLDIIENNLKYIMKDEKDEYDVPYKEVYSHELSRIAKDTQEYYINSKYYTRDEIITLLRAEFIGCFGGDCIDSNRAIYERIMYEYYDRIKIG